MWLRKQYHLSVIPERGVRQYIYDPTEQQFTQIKSKESPQQQVPTTSEVEGNTARPWLYLALIFITAVALMSLVYLSFPKVDEDEEQYIKLPKNIEDAKNLGRVLSRYKDSHYTQVLTGYFFTYIFLQTFAIPGSIFLSILSGFLFPFPLALFLVCLCSSIGATFLYLLSYLVGRRLVKKYIPERVKEWQSHVNNHREHLLNYMIFLRITPFLPNWFINIAAPVINVPLFPFFLGTFLGVAPPSFVAIQAGTTLHQLTSSGDAVSFKSVIILAGLFGRQNPPLGTYRQVDSAESTRLHVPYGVAPPSFVAIQAGTTLHQLTSSGDAVSFKSVIILGVFAVVSLLPVVFKNKLKKKLE